MPTAPPAAPPPIEMPAHYDLGLCGSPQTGVPCQNFRGPCPSFFDEGFIDFAVDGTYERVTVQSSRCGVGSSRSMSRGIWTQENGRLRVYSDTASGQAPKLVAEGRDTLSFGSFVYFRKAP